MNTEKVLRRIVIGGLFSLPFVVLIVSTNLFFPYITGKNFAFRIIVEVMFSAWVVLAFMYARYRPRPTPLPIAITAFVGITTIAGLLGENPFKSFWSNYERMDGAITLLHLLALVVIMQTTITSERLWMWWWRVSLAVSAFVSLHTLVQFLASDGSGARLYSTLGNPIYLAVYALFHIFVALVLAVRKDGTNLERWLYFGVVPFLLFSVYLTSTRGATLGIIGGLIVAACGVAYAHKNDKRVAIGALVTGVALVLAVAGFWTLRDSSFVQNDPLLKRFASISLSDASISARTMIWGMAIDGVKEKPVLGWGQENFNYVFNKYYNPMMYNLEPWYDRTHNAVFDWLIASGALGLMAYLSIFIALVWALYRAPQFTLTQKWVLFGLVLAYAFQNLTVFDQVVSYIFFFALIGWIMAKEPAIQETKTGSRSIEKYAAMLVIPLALFLVWGVNNNAYQANKLLLQALRQEAAATQLAQAGRLTEAHTQLADGLLLFLEAGSRRSYGGQEVHEQLTQSAARVLTSAWTTQEERSGWYAAAVVGIQSEVQRAPHDARLVYFESTVYAAANNLDAEYQALLHLNELTPHKPMVLVALANNAMRRGDSTQAQTYAKEVHTLAPKYLTGSEVYALALIALEKYDALDQLAEEEPLLGSRQNVLRTLINAHEYERAGRIWDTVLQHGSQTEKTVYQLGIAYYMQGEKARSLEEIKRAMRAFPEYADAGADILKQIQAVR